MADHKECKHYEVCDYRNGVGCCPDSCVQFKNKDTVTVVRCKDCKWRHSSEFCECRPEDGFCNDGERAEINGTE